MRQALQEVVSIADNKQKTYDVLSSAGINVPFTCSTDDFNPEPENFPVIIKPREGGARSKNVFKVKTPKQYASVIQMLGEDTADYIVMDYIEGDEYTCGSISLDGKCHGIIVMRRQLRDGDTYKCFVENNDLIQEAVRKVVETVKPFGALNVQLRLKDQTPYIFELNARCSGTTAARTLSGFNEPKMIADYLLKGISPDFSIKEQSILRYWQELVVDNTDIAQISTARHLKK
jgi:carbamoyl-phosphate synthase large subunit